MIASRRPSRRLANRKRLRDEKRRLLSEAIAAYGGRCECCGETEPMFLTIDHVRARHSTEGTGVSMYRELRRAGWPKDDYRLMCFNCNCGRERAGGVCPHRMRAGLAG